jgi:ribosomal protein L11 methyltransferase
LKEDYQPFSLGSRFCILPPDLTPPPGNHINLTMERGAFGSGEHETTRSCLEILENFTFSGNEKILDLGSGTGILSIASLLLGGGKAWCVDIEEAAVKSCVQNCRLNGVNDKVVHVCGPLKPLQEDGFDLILANIYGDILLDVAEELVARARPGAKLLLSGILWEYNFDVRRKYQKLGCKLIKNQLLEDFSTIYMEKL